MACDSLDIDINKKSTHELKIDDINIPDDWNIGVIYGASGSGKTTLIEQTFGKDALICEIDTSQPIINQFPDHMNYEDCSRVLNGIGLTSVPCWVRPVYTLSNGQKARAIAALEICKDKEIIFIDEFTSVVDRTVAKVMSECVQKMARRTNRKIVLLTCHYDILAWLKPDWMIDCNKQIFDGFFLPKKNNSNSTSEKSTGHHGDILASIII